MNQTTVNQRDFCSYVTSRLMEYEGELRAATIRVVLVAAFYTVQLIHYLVFAERTDAEQAFHRQATYLAAGWLFLSLGVLVLLSRHWLPAWLKYVTVALDVCLLTASAALGNGPNSPVVIALALLISLAALRTSVPLIWFATLFAMGGYLFLIGSQDKNWFDADHATPPVQQMVMLLTLAATGLVNGQLVRLIRQTATETMDRLQREPTEAR